MFVSPAFFTCKTQFTGGFGQENSEIDFPVSPDALFP
jgi:hypothetical protein